MSVRLSLAEQIAQLAEAAPVDFDPEDVLAQGDVDETAHPEAVRDHYVDVGRSSLRKLQNITDLKYEGMKTSRKQLMEESDQEESGQEESDHSDGKFERIRVEDEEDTPSQSESDDTGEEQQTTSTSPLQKQWNVEPDPLEDLPTALQKTREADRQKGKVVSQQIAIWESLLDARIRLQKSVAAANRLPSSSQLPRYTELVDCRQSLESMLEEAFLLSDELFDLQEKLLLETELIVPPPRKRRRIEADATPSDFSSQLLEATRAAAALEHAYQRRCHPYLVQTLSKWSSKIQAVAPSILLPSNRNAFSSRNSQNLKSAVHLIDETLLDHKKLVARTQLRRSKDARLGETMDLEEEEGKIDTDVFDDTDFYQQLLRDIIDSRSNNGNGVDDWMTIQKQKKAKKKVDTKASKGRKLRYEVHEKLQNFMVPVPAPGMWHEEQIDELFSSLMGRGFEGTIVNEDESMAADEPPLDDVLKHGFRVFG
ncbi:apoptosis-antagonizing transcription factor, partial [Mycena pura]